MIRTLLLPALLAVGLAAGSGRALAEPVHAKGPEPLEISHGKDVDLSNYLVPGKITVFDFYSHYCPPCMAMKPLVAHLHETHPGIAVVEVNINRPGVEGIDWESPVAKEFSLDSIPHFRIYSAKGKLVADGDPAYDMVVGWIK
jgi:thiol-disulfide isomerase/thioredoxin